MEWYINLWSGTGPWKRSQSAVFLELERRQHWIMGSTRRMTFMEESFQSISSPFFSLPYNLGAGHKNVSLEAKVGYIKSL